MIDPEIHPVRADVIERLVAFKKQSGLSFEEIANLIGSSAAQVNRAVNKKFKGDPITFEAKVEDFLKNEPKRRRDSKVLFENDFSREVGNFLETVRRTNDIGIGHCQAGMGKTKGITLYVIKNPTTISAELPIWDAGVNGVERILFNCIETRGWDHNTSRGDFISARLSGSHRLIIIDNAHKLSFRSRQWLFDFHDQSGCPIALIGNPEILEEIKKNDQQFSRVGLLCEFRGQSASVDAERMIKIHWPDAEGKLDGLPIQVIKEQGHLRSLRKHLELARDIATAFDSPEEAFRAAHTKLVTNYKLK
jgi:DNA transposition AAA+ family ATPase